ncbi:hypothetical protein RB595_007156 [Gaeumannomyces hyphopodioides]
MNLCGAAERCRDLLLRATKDQGLRATDPQLSLQLEGELVRFLMWAGNVGIFARDSASLGYRLRNDPDTIEVLESTLKLLGDSVHLAVNPPLIEDLEDEPGDAAADRSSTGIKGGCDSAESNAGSSSGHSSSSSSAISLDPEIEDEAEDDAAGDSAHKSPISPVKEVLDRLYRMASLIRKPPSSSENSRVNQFLDRLRQKPASEELQEVEAQLKDIEDHVRSHLEAIHLIQRSENKISEALRERLVAAAVFRRLKLIYRNRHQTKLRQGARTWIVNPRFQPRIAPVNEIEHDQPTTQQLPNQEIHWHTQQARQQTAAAPSQVMSSTHASSAPRLAIYAKSVARSGITEAAVERRRNLKVPAPRCEQEQSECPLCFRIITRDVKEEPQWTRHVLEDIDPYVCLFECCEDGHASFSSIKDWLSHMQWQHTSVWACQTCQNKGHEYHSYTTALEMEEHIRAEHHGSFTEAQLPDLVQLNCLPAQDTFTILALSNHLKFLSDGGDGGPLHECPICLDFQDSPRQETDSPSSTPSPQDPSNIQHHILQHLESIALLSLPKQETNEMETLATSNYPQQSQTQSAPNQDEADAFSVNIDQGESADPHALDRAWEQQNPGAGTEPPKVRAMWEGVFLELNPLGLSSPSEDSLLIRLHSKQKGKSLYEDTEHSSRATSSADLPALQGEASGSKAVGADPITPGPRLSIQEMKRHLSLAIDGSSSVVKFLPQSDLESLVNATNVFSILLESGHPEGGSNAVQRKRPARILLMTPAAGRPELTPRQVAEVEELSKKVVQPTHGNQSKAPGDQQPHSCSGYRKIFVILLLIDQLDQLHSFVEFGVCDDDLPLIIKSRRLGHRWPEEYTEQPAVEFVRGLSSLDPEAFEIVQQWVCVATLRGSSAERVPHYYIPTSVTLPWTMCTEADQGRFAVIFKTRIHLDHYDFHENKPQTTKHEPEFFALKRSHNLRIFEKQLLLFNHIRKHKHQNMAVAGITKGADLYLIFPWAETNLMGYWKHQLPSPKSALWLVQQCLGLLGALNQLHSHAQLNPDVRAKLSLMCLSPINSANLGTSPSQLLTGQHGSIEPNNILWFPDEDGGTLKISGFSCFAFLQGSPHEDYVAPRGLATYDSPESMFGLMNSRCDIWSLGCTLLEFITWCLLGWADVEKFDERRSSKDAYRPRIAQDTFVGAYRPLFTQDRFMDAYSPRIAQDTFFETGEHGRHQLKEPVIRQIIDLHSHPGCPTSIRDLLDVVTTHMLVIDRQGRSGMREAMVKVEEIFGRCQQSQEYATKPAVES